MPLVFSCVVPHPPVIIPSVGRNNLKDVQKTVLAMESLSKKFVQTRPETVLVISPHTPLLPRFFCIKAVSKMSGGFQNFGAPEENFEFLGDLDFANQIVSAAKKEKLPVLLSRDSDLDHGVLVPLYFFSQNWTKFRLVVLSLSMLDLQTHFHLGKFLQRVIQKQAKKIAIVASGDLSHRLTPDAPAGYNPRGKKFDELLIKLLKKKETQRILELDPKLIEDAGECGFRSIIILLGILENLDYNVKILSYEGPFGVGYLVLEFTF